MCVWALCVCGWVGGLVCCGRLRGMRVVLVVGGVWGRGSVGGGIKDEGKPETKSTAALADKGNAIRRATLNATHASAVWPPPFTFFNPPPPLLSTQSLISYQTPGGRTKTSCSSLTIFSSLFCRFLLRVVVVCFFLFLVVLVLCLAAIFVSVIFTFLAVFLFLLQTKPPSICHHVCHLKNKLN